MQIIDLFSGICGFSLAGRWMGWETVQFCETNPYCQQIIKKHFPNIPIHGDIRTLSRDVILSGGWNPQRRTIVVGGFPCQPWSNAGKQKGVADNRHLWPEMFRVIREVQPDWVLGENVTGIVKLALEQVCADLESIGYAVQPFIVPACAVDAPHERKRVWIVAKNINRLRRNSEQSEEESSAGEFRVVDARSDGRTSGGHVYPDADGIRYEEWSSEKVGADSAKNRAGVDDSTERFGYTWNASDAHGVGSKKQFVNRDEIARGNVSERLSGPIHASDFWKEWTTESPLCGVDDGLPARMDGTGNVSAKSKTKAGRKYRIEALGNAVVPQVVYQFFKAIEVCENNSEN